jgi:nicotinamide-nucleotide amidase
MNAEIIAVGSELLTPQRQDTNSLWLTARLNDLGVEVVVKTIVGDDRVRLAAQLASALSRSDIVILTGGLGPTEDDVTRDAAATALGRALVFRQDICDAIEARFRRMHRRMADINRRQAYVIDGAEALPNDRGTAPGMWINDGRRFVALLPGPPNEMKAMFESQLRERLERVVPPLAIRTLQFRVAGMPESEVDALVGPVYSQYANPVTTILAAPSDIQLHLRARCADPAEAERLVHELGAKIRALLGDRIYSENGDPLEATVGRLLRERGATVAVAESCTGGALADRLSSVAGSSDYFAGGFLTYNDRMKTQLLGIDPELLASHGAVSEPVALAMAERARERSAADYAVAVTGIAGPDGGTELTPVGTVFIALAAAAGSQARQFRLPGDRGIVRAIAVQTALDMLRRRLLT